MQAGTCPTGHEGRERGPCAGSAQAGAVRDAHRLFRAPGRGLRLIAAGPRTDAGVLLGETGTGKEVVAQTSLRSPPGSRRSFRQRGAVPRPLESEMLGHGAAASPGPSPAQGVLRARIAGHSFGTRDGMPVELQVKLIRVWRRAPGPGRGKASQSGGSAAYRGHEPRSKKRSRPASCARTCSTVKVFPIPAPIRERGDTSSAWPSITGRAQTRGGDERSGSPRQGGAAARNTGLQPRELRNALSAGYL